MHHKEIVKRLPDINQVCVNEENVMGKQTRQPFTTGKIRRATSPLELVHANVFSNVY